MIWEKVISLSKLFKILKMEVILVVAVDEPTYGIGYNGQLLYKNKCDLKRFQQLTTSGQKNAILMGRVYIWKLAVP